MKKILIISSDNTGHGHKSITSALCEEFDKHPDIKVHVVDGFALGGDLGIRVSKLYGTLTRNAKDLWKLVWEISLKKPSMVDEIVEIAIKDKLLDLLERVDPDLIISVHPNFNGSVLNVMEEYNINIPFVSLIADLISITPLWADPRADYIICPSLESKEKCLEFGIPESKLILTGFPIRSKFFRKNEESIEEKYYTEDRPLECLIMSGGEGVGNMGRITRILLDNFNCHVKIIAGRNTALKRRLERSLLDKYGDRVTIYGFVNDIQDLMYSSDIAFTRGSPNVALEAVACNVPLVITGALPGQEEGNPWYIENYNLGVFCEKTRNIKHLVNDLLKNNAEKLNNIKKSQREFRDPYAAKNIVEHILKIEKRKEKSVSEIIREYNNKYNRKLRLVLRERQIKRNE